MLQILLNKEESVHRKLFDFIQKTEIQCHLLVIFASAFGRPKSLLLIIKIFKNMKDQTNAAHVLRERMLNQAVEQLQTLNEYKAAVAADQPSPILDTYDALRMHAEMCACEALTLDDEAAAAYISRRLDE